VATYNSSSINRDPPTGRAPGVYPVKVAGTINIASNTSFGSTAPDTLPICVIPFGSILTNVIIGFPALDGGSGLGFTLQDTLASPTTYISAITQGRAGGVITFTNMSVTNELTLGTMYGSTARLITATGSPGSPVVVWASGTKLVLSCATSSTNTTGATALNITYIVEWSAIYDAGT
jgi:hypothetical protein